MPIYQYECPSCYNQQEHILSVSEMERFEELAETIGGVGGLLCECGAIMKHIQAIGGQYCSNEDADWIRSVREVVGHDNPLPEAQRFMKDPTRQNYKTWMKAQGLRPLENGEKRQQPEFDINAHTEKIMQRRQKRRRIEI